MPSEGQKTESIGERLKRLRLERGLSQRDLSEPGVSYAYISRIEAGARSPSVKALRKLSRQLGVSVDYLETGREIGDADQRDLDLNDAELELRLGNAAEATERFRGLSDEARVAGDHVAASRASVGLGFAAAKRGNHLEAVERLEEALEEHRVSPHSRPDVYATLGQSYSALGAADRAVRVFEAALAELAEDVPQAVSVQIRFAALLSYALTDAGEHARARAVVREALERAGGDEDPRNRIRLYWSLARVATHEGQLGEALRFTRRALTLLELLDDTMQVARGYLMAAGIEAREGDVEATRRHLAHAERLLGPDPERRDLGILRTGQSWLSALDGDAEAAVARAREALDFLGTAHGGEQGTATWALARGLTLAGEIDHADAAYERAIDLLGIHGRQHDAATAAGDRADALERAGRSDAAAAARERAAALAVSSPQR
jgi:transcriptional regulator with XRE-family HTH domain